MSRPLISERLFSQRLFPQGTLTPMDALLFAAAEQGAFYDPSNLSTLYQDSAFTVPVTAVEQPVGGMLDLSGRGNHASMATTTKRPIYSRRVNLLTRTENMVPTFVAGTAWTRGAFANWETPTNLGPTLAPDGSNNAVGIRRAGTNGLSSLVHRSSVFPSTTYKFTVQVRKVEGEDQTGLPGLRLLFQTGNNGVLVSTAAATMTIGTSVSDSWQQFEISYTTPATGVNQVEVGLQFPTVAAAAVAVWGGSLTLATDAHLPYQRVNTATDYDADPSKFPAYLRFDGVDDALQTGNIDFTATDKMTVWAGVTKLSDPATGVSGTTITELTTSGSGPGSVSLFGSWSSVSAGNPGLACSSAGTTRANAIEAGVATAAPFSGPVTVAASIPTSALTLRANGSVIASSSNSLGTGTYANAALYIGARAGASVYFNGRLYSLIVRGAQSSLSQIEATELYIKQKMRLP